MDFVVRGHPCLRSSAAVTLDFIYSEYLMLIMFVIWIFRDNILDDLSKLMSGLNLSVGIKFFSMLLMF